MSKISYSESELDFSNSLSTPAPIFSESESESDDCESDFNSVFINLGICIFLPYKNTFLLKILILSVTQNYLKLVLQTSLKVSFA